MKEDNKQTVEMTAEEMAEYRAFQKAKAKKAKGDGQLQDHTGDEV